MLNARERLPPQGSQWEKAQKNRAWNRRCQIRDKQLKSELQTAYLGWGQESCKRKQTLESRGKPKGEARQAARQQALVRWSTSFPNCVILQSSTAQGLWAQCSGAGTEVVGLSMAGVKGEHRRDEKRRTEALWRRRP